MIGLLVGAGDVEANWSDLTLLANGKSGRKLDDSVHHTETIGDSDFTTARKNLIVVIFLAVTN